MTSFQRDYDVIVVGAGPAGASTALYAHRHGLRVALLDRARFPRDKICGDAVARKSIGYLRDLGVLDRVRLEPHEPIDTAELSSPSGETIRIHLQTAHEPERPHMICRREILDDVLVREARRRVDVFEGTPATGLVRHPSDGVCGVRCASPDGPQRELSARVVVGADGFGSVVARSLGLYRYDSRRWWVATRQYFRGLDVAPGTVEVHYLRETLPGFLWMFPCGDGVVNVGVGMIHRDSKRRGGVRAVHDRALSDARFRGRFEAAEPLGGMRGWNLPTPDARRPLCGDGFVLVGDAAGLVDPFTGEGIGNAMCSGEVAARAIAAACQDRAADLSRYPRLLWRALDERELALHYRLRAIARRRRLIDFIVGRAAAHRDVLEWLAGMTSERGAVEKKRSLASPLTYLRLMWRGR